jgi:aminoglycoside phosphotransferase (APT) family kinase protein
MPDVDPFGDEAQPELAAVRFGEDLDWKRIELYLRESLPVDLAIEGEFEVLQFPNGAANLTYLIRFDDVELVLRRPPFGTIAPGAHDMKREFKVLSRLWRVFDRAPRAYVLCDDPEIADADFFVMERKQGEVIRGVIPMSMRAHQDVGRRLGFALIDAIAEFHAVDPGSCDLGRLGRPEGFVERQVVGWKKRWDLVAAQEHDVGMCAVHGRLEASIPTSQRVAIVHNDLKLDNAMFDPSDPDHVVAIFDWDMATLGDPLIDLGTLLNYWPEGGDPSGGRVSHDGMSRMGLPTRSELIERYAERTGLDVSQARWYTAFAFWKTAVVAQQLHFRWAQGDSTDERMATMGGGIGALITMASGLLDESGI